MEIGSDNVNLISLPNELIIKILSYANPSVLLSLASSEDLHLRSFTFVPELLRSLNFCKKTSILTSNLKEFLKSAKRRKEIENLCVRGYENLGCVLFNSGFIWSRLHKLDISQCGINVTGLFSILNHLDELDELTWSTFILNSKNELYTRLPTIKRQKVESIFTDFKIKKLKILNIDVLCASETLPNILVLLALFKDITVLRIKVLHILNHNYDKTCLLPLNAIDLMSLEYSDRREAEHAISLSAPTELKRNFNNLQEFVLSSDNHQRWGRNYPVITHVRCICSNLHCFVKYRVKNPSLLKKTVSVIQKELDFRTDLDWITLPNILSELNVQSKELNSEIVEWIKFHGGEALKCLSLSNCHSNWKQIKALLEIFKSCPNILELNLDGYFDIDKDNENCTIFSHIPKLKALVLSDVLLGRNESSSTSNLNSAKSDFPGRKSRKRISHQVEIPDDSTEYRLNVAAPNIQNLQVLEIRSVINTSRAASLTDGDLVPISQFSKLKSLTLSYLSGCIRGRSLSRIFSSCAHLKHLRLYHLEYNNSGVCLYQDTLIQSLPLLKNLQVLSIHHCQFDWAKESVWIALAQLQELKRLCIASNKHDSSKINAVHKFLNKVPNLEAFHIHSRISNVKQLETAVKKHVCFAFKPNAEIVMQNLTSDLNVFKISEWTNYIASLENIRYLCWGMGDIAYGLHTLSL